MKDEECVRFLKWSLPRLRLAYEGFRRVRHQLCKRIGRRLGELGLADIDSYREYLLLHPLEWEALDTLTLISISRFYRDKKVFECIQNEILPHLARRHARIGCLSLGCASGEEPYTLSLVWELGLKERFKDVGFEVVAADIDPGLFERAKSGCYKPSSIRELPEGWKAAAFRECRELFCLKEAFKTQVVFIRQDIRTSLPPGPFHLILCRNLAFTYFDETLRLRIVRGLKEGLVPGGYLVLGSHEVLPPETRGFRRIGNLTIFKRD